MIPQGFLLIDKPAGMTSHDVVDSVRRLTGVRRVGHAGTLDPSATGLLIVAVGSATKRLQELVGLDKEYQAEFGLGATSTTDDAEGVVTPRPMANSEWQIAIEDLTSAMRSFIGETMQMPPAYSAIKIKGRKLYEYARKGQAVEVKPRRVRIDSFELVDPIPQSLFPVPCSLNVRIRCSSGTYIRAIARDLGQRLGVGGYVQTLRRTAIGPYRVEQARTLEELQKIGSETGLVELPAS